MKHKWLAVLLFAALTAGFASCYRPYGYHGYSDYDRYGRSYYGHSHHLERHRRSARHRVVRRDSRRDYHASRYRLEAPYPYFE